MNNHRTNINCTLMKDNIKHTIWPIGHALETLNNRGHRTHNLTVKSWTSYHWAIGKCKSNINYLIAVCSWVVSVAKAPNYLLSASVVKHNWSLKTLRPIAQKLQSIICWSQYRPNPLRGLWRFMSRKIKRGNKNFYPETVIVLIIWIKEWTLFDSNDKDSNDSNQIERRLEYDCSHVHGIKLNKTLGCWRHSRVIRFRVSNKKFSSAAEIGLAK